MVLDVAPAGTALEVGTDQITSPGLPGWTGVGGVHTSDVVTVERSGLFGATRRSLSTIVTTPRGSRTGMVFDEMKMPNRSSPSGK